MLVGRESRREDLTQKKMNFFGGGWDWAGTGTRTGRVMAFNNDDGLGE